MDRRRIVIAGAAGRDFHNFNVVYRDDPSVEVVAFTATQIPGIAGRTYPPALAGPRYPLGIRIVPEGQLDQLIRREHVDEVVFSYSDVSHETVMHLASRTIAAGADFTLLGAERTMLKSTRPVLAIGASRTGSGKSQTSRYLVGLLDDAGIDSVVVRHPMPYGDLERQAVQRFETYEDLAEHDVTIEEREEYEPHLATGHIVYAGVDYEGILRRAELDASVVVWDGGNNDLPFYKPDLFVVVVDPLRAGDELRFHPGETAVRMADVIVINKIDSADPQQVATVRRNVTGLNPGAQLVTARSETRVEGASITGKRVVVVEDGPTLTHGGMTFGAGVVAARRAGAVLVDPRPDAVGSIAEVLATYPRLEPLVPAMGYSPEQTSELEATLDAVDADLVLAATPIDLGALLHLKKPVVRVRYDLEQVSGPPLRDLLGPIVEAARVPVLAGR